MSAQFRAMMVQAEIDGKRAQQRNTVAVFRGISRAQTYHKTASDLKWISMVQLAHWMQESIPTTPMGLLSYYNFANKYGAVFVKLAAHGFLNFGRYDNGRWDHWHHNGHSPEWLLFQLTEDGSRFLKECPSDDHIIRYMGLHK